MRISVVTGPVFGEDDPELYGVKIPVEFWKVIAFVHDDTEELTATGYVMSQRDFLSDEEFVYGQHATSQRSLAEIERKTGLSFGRLKERDPLRDREEAALESLSDFEQIRFY